MVKPRILIAFLLFLFLLNVPNAKATDIGVFYFPGWHSESRYWKDLKGLPDSRSPNTPWPDREPLLGYYAEEDIKVAIQHIYWANQYGITFFAYDWYWDGKATSLNHAIDNYLKAPNNAKIKFSILWANHSAVPRSIKEFDDMIAFWLKYYLIHPQFYRVNGKPVVFVFLSGQLEYNAGKFGLTIKALLQRADDFVRDKGLPGIFFVVTTNARPDDNMADKLLAHGFSAYTGFNYVTAKDKSQIADYQSMVDTYLEFYKAAFDTKGILPYIVPVSPGWDSRPWYGAKAIVRSEPTPEKFRQMITAANQLAVSKKKGILDVVMIEAWNEFGEGSYIEPTRKWGFKYLEVIKETFSPTVSVR